MMNEQSIATLHEGDATWHDGPGWYYTDDECMDEGSIGAFASKEEAAYHAHQAGYFVRFKRPRSDRGTPSTSWYPATKP